MAQTPNAPAGLGPGDHLGRYRIDSLLGSGGMGAVYRAYDATLQRPVAIKVLRPDGPGDSPGRLLREARSSSALNHPNICTVYEIGEERGAGYIAMEYVDGPSLASRLADAPLSTSDAVQFGIDIADALAHAHARGVVHRDLKTANAIVSSSGRVKLVDFGLARRMNSGAADASTMPSIAAAGTAVGTPYAMAPEQVRGETVDVRTDIWGLGVLLYEMLTGSPPFRGATLAELFASILRDPFPPLPGVRAMDPLREIVDTCLAKDPEQRYQSAEEARLALEEIGTAAPPRARSSSSVAVATSPTPLPPPSVLERGPDESPFVGRARERAQLQQALDDARQGRRQLVLLAGEPGIGKTRLALETTRDAAAAGSTVLAGRCWEEALVPYQPFVEALTWYVRVRSDTELRRDLGAIGGGSELSTLLPDLTRRVPDLPSPTPMNPEGQRYRLFETVNALLGALAQANPVALLLDDLHWADKPTLLMLRHLVRASEPGAICIIGTYRESELGRTHPLAETLADLRREQRVTRVALQGLEQGQVGELMGAVAGAGAGPALVQQVAESTNGNPFFVGEMVRHLQETGALTTLAGASDSAVARATLGLPEGVKEVIGRRLTRLSETCNRILSLASVVGREFDLQVLETLGDVSEDQLLDAIDEASHARLIDDVPGRAGRYSFHHALIRSTLYDELTTPRRVRLHRRIGEALERLAEGSAAPPLSDLAYHFVQAAPTGVADKAVDYALRAGDAMAATLAHEEAGRFYDLALQTLEAQPAGPQSEAQRVVLHRRRARAFGALAQWTAQKAALEEALVHLAPGQAEPRCEILSELASAHFWLLDIPSGERVVTEALQLAEQLGRSDIAANAMGWLARCRMATRTPVDGYSLDLETIDRFGPAARVSFTFGPLNLYLAGKGVEAVALSTQSADMAERSSDTGFIMNSLAHHALGLSSIGRYAEADQVFRRVLDFGRKYGVLPLLARTTSMSAGFRLAIGDYDGAEAIQTEARELAKRINFAPTIVSPGIDLLLIAARRGEPGNVDTLLSETVAGAARMPGWHDWLWQLRIEQARAELSLARGAFEDAIRLAASSIEQSRTRTRPKYEALGYVTRAQALHRLGRTRDAIADARKSVEIATRIADPALLLRALDALLALDGDDEALAQARTTIASIAEALPTDELRQRFLRSEASSWAQRS